MTRPRKPLPSWDSTFHGLEYDPGSGEFRFTKSCGRVRAGDVAGSLNDNGHLRISIDGQRYYAHRLAWFYMTGEDLGDTQLVHKDGNLMNNSFENLRKR